MRDGRVRAGATLLVCAALVAGGCGGEPREEIAEQVREYAFELADGRWNQACERLTPAARERLGGPLLGAPGEEALECDDALERVYGGSFEEGRGRLVDREVRDARVEVRRLADEQAQALLRTGRLTIPVALVEADGEWLIDRFGPAGERTAVPARPPVP